MKYRRLEIDELKSLEDEFVKFLSSNSIPGDDWEKMKQEKPDLANAFIDDFSDIVLDRTLKNIKYLEFRTPNDIKVFHCMEEKMILLGIMVDGETDLDLTQPFEVQEMIKRLEASNASLKAYRAEKSYSKEREMELFEMIQHGCLVTNDVLYKNIEILQK